ncbi:MAG: HEAT repeat domain-containing protein [Pyrinomonadaceae bacterium]
MLATAPASAQDLTALETTLRTGTAEQKRDALFQIRNLRSEIASRIAVPSLNDTDPLVRATAAAAVTFLPKPEAIAVLTPLLNDKDAFVRKEAAYALGKVESPDSAAPLLALVDCEKDLEVKAAAAFALGYTGNPSALAQLTKILNDRPKEETEFLRRSAARSIGQIAQTLRSGNANAVTPQSFLPENLKDLSTGSNPGAHFNAPIKTLETVLRSSKEADDTRREAAFALGSIGSGDSVTVLQTASTSSDPYLLEIAREALAKIANTNPAN